eukprot:scaffold66475_cov63-Phaeocystis_antarctica.AAC.2
MLSYSSAPSSSASSSAGASSSPSLISRSCHSASAASASCVPTAASPPPPGCCAAARQRPAPLLGRVRARHPRPGSASASAASARAHSCGHMRCGCSTRRISPEANSAGSSSASKGTRPETRRKSLRLASPRRTCSAALLAHVRHTPERPTSSPPSSGRWCSHRMPFASRADCISTPLPSTSWQSPPKLSNLRSTSPWSRKAMVAVGLLSATARKPSLTSSTTSSTLCTRRWHSARAQHRTHERVAVLGSLGSLGSFGSSFDSSFGSSFDSSFGLSRALRALRALRVLDKDALVAAPGGPTPARCPRPAVQPVPHPLAEHIVGEASARRLHVRAAPDGTHQLAPRRKSVRRHRAAAVAANAARGLHRRRVFVGGRLQRGTLAEQLTKQRRRVGTRHEPSTVVDLRLQLLGRPARTSDEDPKVLPRRVTLLHQRQRALQTRLRDASNHGQREARRRLALERVQARHLAL